MAIQTFTTTYEEAEFKALLAECVSETVQKQIAQLINPSLPEKQILTRQETAKLLNISLPTLHDYTKRDIILAYRLGYKVRYKLVDIQSALLKIKNK